MSSLKKLVVISVVAAAMFGALQIQAGAAVLPLNSWSLAENPIANGTPLVDTGTAPQNLTYNVNGGVTSATGVWGVPNTAAHFDGTWNNSASGAIPAGGILYPLYSTGYTVEAFFKYDGGATVEPCIYGEGTSAGIAMGLVLKKSGSNWNQITFQVLKPGIWWGDAVLTTATVNPGTWYYAAGTCKYDSGTNITTVSTYLYDTNGTLLGSISATSNATYGTYYGTPTGGAVNMAVIGTERTDGGAPYGFPGTIDNVNLYGSILDAATMSLHAKSNTDIPEPSTLVLLAAGLTGLLAYAWRKRR
jgi:hypothetical protein